MGSGGMYLIFIWVSGEVTEVPIYWSSLFFR